MGIQNALAALLLNGPAHGYELHATLEAELGPLWETRSSQVYLTLGRMQRDELVTSRRIRQDKRPDRQLLELTQRGRRQAEAWLYEPSPSDDLVVHLAVARVVTPDRFAEIAQSLLADRSGVLRTLRAIREAWTEGFQAEAVDAEIQRVQAEVRWLSRVHEHADQIMSRPRATRRRVAQFARLA